jgi:predicted alpha/beta hydrolase
MRELSCLYVAILMFSVTLDAQARSVPTIVTLEARDGTALKASFFSSAKPGPALLLLPQCDNDRSSMAGFAATAVANGYHVLTLDYRGFGDSGGRHPESRQEQAKVMATTWPGDVDVALAWLLARPVVDRTRVGAVGASCGATQAAHLARRQRVLKTVVMLSGGTAPEVRAFLGEARWLPVLGVASLDDGPMVSQMRWLISASSHPASRFVEVPTGGHGTEMFAAQPDLPTAILEWFATHLKIPPPAGP